MKSAVQNNVLVPIYRQLVQHYKQAILKQDYRPGSRIDSIHEIMQRHQVSRETAKLVLKSLAAEGLIIQKPGKGSFIADLGPRRKIWAVIAPFFSSQTEQLVHHLRQQLAPLDRRLEIYIDYNNWQEEIRLVGTLINERYEAVLLIPTFDESRTASFYKRLQTGKTYLTLLNHTMSGSSFTYVIQSYDLGVRRAVQYLMDKHGGAIVYIKNNIWLGRNMVQEVMQETLKTSLRREPASRPFFIIDDINSLDRDFIDRHRVNGLFCCEDIDAIRMIGRLKEWGYSLPGDVALVSYGNTDLARFFTPAITSIDPHMREMAVLSTNIIMDSMRGKNVDLQQYVLHPELVVRET
ncbi:GntR family transcriptional regulator [candidate division KSB1 bacterium]|nr:GntR family transcriptional regulator [candidate division KSB1 bacterium]